MCLHNESLNNCETEEDNLSSTINLESDETSTRQRGLTLVTDRVIYKPTFIIITGGRTMNTFPLDVVIFTDCFVFFFFHTCLFFFSTVTYT